jgi:hypothetical protein
MKKLQFGAILVGALVAAPLHASMAQSTNVAYANANEPRPGYIVFFDKGTPRLSSVADETVRKAAADADRSAGLVRVVGRSDYANVVKDKLVRDGVPARAIVVVPQTGSPLPGTGDGLSDPDNRRVEIRY